MNPFTHISNKEHAKVLAQAFTVADSMNEVWAALRMYHQIRGRDLFGYLESEYFESYQDSAHEIEPKYLRSIREAAYEYLERS